MVSKLRSITLEHRDGEYVLVVRIPIEVGFDKGCITIMEGDLPDFSLTERERQVLEQVCRFKSNKEIGNILGLAERTVKFHVSSLLLKAKVGGRSELANRYRSKPPSKYASLQ